MDKAKMIAMFLDMIETYDKFQNPTNPWNEEIRMWRMRFLEANPGLEKEKYCAFLFTPSETLMRETPEQLFKKFKDFS